MPDSRRHRSAGPADRELFAPERERELRVAATHLAWLLDRGYPERSSLELVGNRFSLKRRQRDALGRAACTEAQRRERAARLVPGALEGRPLAIDGFNLLTTVESALGGGLVLLCRDGCARDLASLHGTWRRVAETRPALEAIATRLAARGAGPADWYLDAPVSNSGRLAAALRGFASERELPWEARVVGDPDRDLTSTDAVVVSSDRAVLDGCDGWTNLARDVVERVEGAWLLDLGAGS